MQEPDAPTNCPYCKKLLVGEVRSFCRSCNETFEDSKGRWINTEEPVFMTYR